MYWSTLDNCFQERRYCGERTILNGHISYPEHQTWTSQCVYEQPGSINALFGNQNAASDDCRLTNQIPYHFSSSLLPTEFSLIPIILFASQSISLFEPIIVKTQ